jgi:hypothetical protein
MNNVNILTIRSMRQSIEDLLEPLEIAQLEISGEIAKKARNALDLIMGELTVTALILTNVDLKVSADELDFINDVRRTIYDAEVSPLNSTDYEDLCRQFLHLYPKERLTIDGLPNSIRYLDAYDQQHKTAYAEKARALFLLFAEALVSADRNKDSIESIMVLNFKDILYPPSNVE